VWVLLLSWGVAAAGFAGLGSLVLPRDHRPSQYRFFDAFWIGIYLSAVLLQIVHWVAPVGPPLGAAIVGVGLVAGARRCPADLRCCISARICWWLVPLVLWAAAASLREPPQWDFGLYHLPAVRWTQAYPIVPGLANLHWALGHDSTFTLLAAALDEGRWSRLESWHLAGGLLVCMLAWEAAVGMSRIAGAANWLASDVFRALLLPLAASLIGNWLPTLSPDLATTVVAGAAAARLAVMLLDNAQPPAGTVWVAIALALFGATLKLTAAAYFGCVWLIALGLLYRDGTLPRRRAVALAIGMAAIAGFHVWRTVVLTGYPFYPTTMLPIAASWRVPADVVRDHAVETYWHTRGVEDAVPARQWIAHWLPGILWSAGRFQVLLPLAAGVSALAAGAIAGSARSSRPLALFLLPAIAGALFWLITTPEPRLAGAVFWHAGIGLVLVSMQAMERARRIRLLARLAPAAVLVLIALYLLAGSQLRELRAPWLGPAVPPRPAVARVVTGSGLVLNRPTEDDRCLDTPLPCTPDVEPGLSLRHAGNLAGGFVSAR
jgi:hypothetical protein